jgi:hypothetical protein
MTKEAAYVRTTGKQRQIGRGRHPSNSFRDIPSMISLPSTGLETDLNTWSLEGHSTCKLLQAGRGNTFLKCFIALIYSEHP